MIPPQPFRLFRPAHIYLCHPALKWRARPVLPRLGLARQASIDAVQTHAHKWPARGNAPCSIALRGDCITLMLAGRKSSSLVLPQVPAGYRPAALLVSYRRLNWWFASVLPRVCRVKSPVHRLKCLRTLAPVAGYAPAVFALRGRRVD